MRIRPFTLLSALAGLALFLLLALAPGAGAKATGISDAAAALKQGPVYVDPGARAQLSEADEQALEQKIEAADKPVFIAVLPQSPAFPADSVLRDLRTATGITGLYGIRLGDGFNAGADRTVMPANAVQNVVAGVKTPGADAATQLNNFVDQSLPTVRGAAPASWSSGSGSGTVGNPAELIALAAVLAAGGAGAYAVVRRNRRRRAEEERAALEKLRVVVDEDITAYGEELDRLDFHPSERGADDAMRADYERALDSYDEAKSAMASAQHPHDVRQVTEALEAGRYSLAVLAARREGAPLPERRAPCFFDPRHGPSTADRTWMPAGGAAREVPVCAADAARLADGKDPLARQVDTESGPRPYWEAGPAYGPWAGGYFGGGLLPGLLVGTLLGSALSTPAYAAEYGGGDFGDFSGGDVSGGDFNASDFGGGGFDGGGFGGGGFDGGGF
ncbi:hypothetical protein [Streptomyces sp. FIT100]|uniref:hypothetical protein n=1 Tax=Streptomyces sp. FIT100 TaxID=2837956 RepID=UPI0021C9D17E|nr:hypothetical protein [Streptomyces sp. FIT100]UUN29342.1 hypothetical protein KK483_25390 [Streptomyces sp. FIT100]